MRLSHEDLIRRSSEEFIRTLEGQGIAPEQVPDDDDTWLLNLNGAREVNLAHAPTEICFRLTNPSNRPLHINLGPGRVAGIELVHPMPSAVLFPDLPVPADLGRLQMEDFPEGPIKLHGNVHCNGLCIRGISIVLEGRWDIGEMVAERARFEDRSAGNVSNFERLVITEAVHLEGDTSAATAVIAPGTRIVTNTVLTCESVQTARPTQSLEVKLSGNFVFRAIPHGASLELERGQVDVRKAPDGQSVVDLTVCGPGEQQLFFSGSLIEGLSLETVVPLRVHAKEGAEIFDVRGVVGQLGVNAARIQGARDKSRPFVIQEVVEAMRGEIEYFNPYLLSESDLEVLGTANRVEPLFDAWPKVLKSERAMSFETTQSTTQARRRFHFWAHLETILATKRASGSARADLHIATMRARRQYLDWGSERIWLTLYSLAGYGERIRLPLLVWLGFVLAGATSLAVLDLTPMSVDVGSTAWLELAGNLALSPFAAVFRTQELRPDDVSGSLWDNVIVATMQIIGALVLFQVVVVIRRLTRGSTIP